MTEPTVAYEYLEAGANEMKKRKEVYDPDKDSDGERSMGKTVQLFNTLTGHELTEEQGWMFMVCLKMVRSQSGNYQADDYIDGAAYFGLAGESANKGRAIKMRCRDCETPLNDKPSIIEFAHNSSNQIPVPFCQDCHSKRFGTKVGGTD